KMVKNPDLDPVVDLLDEYRRHSDKIDVEAIDPIENNAKVESLISDVSNKYGGEVQKYKKVTDNYQKTYDKLKELAAAEAPKVQKLPVEQLGNDEETQLNAVAVLQIRSFAKKLSESSQEVDRNLSDKPPNYKAAVEEVRE